MAGHACQTADAIHCLLHVGHPDAAFAMSRTLQEIKFNMLAIDADQSDETAERFREWSFGTMFRKERALRELGHPEMDETEYQKAEATYQSMCRKYGAGFKSNDGWVGKSVFDRAKSVDLDVEYRKFYTVASSFIHTDAQALLLPIGRSEPNKGGILTGPSGIGLDVEAVHTAMSLIYIVVNIPNMLNVEDDEQTVAAFNSLYDSMERMLSAFESIDPQNLGLRFPSEI